MKGWVLDPDSGGVKIPESVQQDVKKRLTKHAEKKYAGMYTKLVIRFRGQFCYIDAHLRGEDFVTHLCRLRYFGGNRWSLGFYTYSNEKYELAMFKSGGFFGTPEKGFDIGAMHLRP